MRTSSVPVSSNTTTTLGTSRNLTATCLRSKSENARLSALMTVKLKAAWRNPTATGTLSPDRASSTSERTAGQLKLAASQWTEHSDRAPKQLISPPVLARYLAQACCVSVDWLSWPCTRADDITTKDNSPQRDTGIKEGLSHRSSHLVDVREPMIPPQGISRAGERSMLWKASLTDRVTFLMY